MNFILPYKEAEEILREDIKQIKETGFFDFKSKTPVYSTKKALEEKGIGRPSTYSPTITTILERRYIEKEQKQLVPTELGKVVNKLLEDSGEDISNIKYIIPHQANLRIIDDAAKKLNISKDKFYINLESYGNTSAASVPIAFSEVINKGLVNKGDKIILVAFGGGLTWAGMLLEL